MYYEPSTLSLMATLLSAFGRDYGIILEPLFQLSKSAGSLAWCIGYQT